MANRKKELLFRISKVVPLVLVLAACTGPTSVAVETVEVDREVTRQVVEQVEVTREVIQEVEVTSTPVPLPQEEPATAENPVQLHLGVGMDASRMAVFLPAFNRLDDEHPEWRLVLDQAPGDQIEKISANIAAGTLPDVQEMSGVWSQQFIQQGALRALDSFIAEDGYNLDDLYPWTAEEFIWQDQMYGMPFVAAPTLVYYNKTMFDTAGLDYPNDDWTFEDMRAAARLLTLDANGNNADSPLFDPDNIAQWGWGNTPGANGAWAHGWLEPFGCDFCTGPDCPQLNMTSEVCLSTLQWWADMVQVDHTAIYDPWSGAQTGIPGNPFLVEKAAMTTDGFFFLGQLAEVGSIDFDIAQPFLGPAGTRASALSTKGYLISSTTEHPREAWRLIQALTSPEFIAEVWVLSGQSMSSHRSAGVSVLDLSGPASNLQSIIDVMEYARPFRPNGPGAFEVYDKIWNLGMQAMSGELSVEAAYTEAESIANEVLDQNR